jgi:hypothetical protein
MSDHSIFPNVHAGIPTAVLVNVYEQAAPRVAQVLTGLTSHELWARGRGTTRWSIGEIVCHLADSEIIAGTRFRLLRHRPGAELVEYDQDVFADVLGYKQRNAHDVDIALQAFAAVRTSTARLMRTWSTSDWETEGVHSEWRSLTLRQLLELYADHGERHIDQILDNRDRLHKPLPLGSILSDRLFSSLAPQVVAAGGAA